MLLLPHKSRLGIAAELQVAKPDPAISRLGRDRHGPSVKLHHGATDHADADDTLQPRLHSVVLVDGSAAIGKKVAELRIDPEVRISRDPLGGMQHDGAREPGTELGVRATDGKLPRYGAGRRHGRRKHCLPGWRVAWGSSNPGASSGNSVRYATGCVMLPLTTDWWTDVRRRWVELKLMPSLLQGRKAILNGCRPDEIPTRNAAPW